MLSGFNKPQNLPILFALVILGFSSAQGQLLRRPVFARAGIPAWNRSVLDDYAPTHYLLPVAGPRPMLVMVPPPVVVKPRPIPARFNRRLQALNGTKLVQWLTRHQWVRETHGNNRSPFIDAMVHMFGGKSGWPWCGYTVLATQKAVGLPAPAGGQKASNCFVDLARISYRAGGRYHGDSAKVGHLLGVSYGNGINHVTRIKSKVKNEIRSRPPRGYWCLGGNEGSGRAAGILLSYYPFPNVRATSNYNY